MFLLTQIATQSQLFAQQMKEKGRAAPVFGIFPGMDVDALIYSLIVVVVGGLGTLSGAIAGAGLVGPADTFGKVLFPQFALALIFAIMAFVLLLRPTGLLGRVRITR